MSAYGKKLDKQAQQLAFTIYKFFKEKTENPTSTEYKNKMKLIPTVAEATGLPETTITKIVMEQKFKSNAAVQNKSAQKRYILLDNISKCEIKRRVIQFYAHYKKPPTLKALNTTFILENVLISSSSYLERLLMEIGFKYVDCNYKQKILLERSSLVSTRWDYLQSLNLYRASEKNVIYVGQTYIASTQKPDEENIDRLGGDGGFIILHAGDNNGFLKGAMMVMHSKFSSKHYENDMNSDNFLWWVKEMLLPNAPPHSLIVMNNASFNSDAVKPNIHTEKSEIEEWLTKHKVPFKENLKKTALLALIDNHQSCGDNELNETIKKAGHVILRIPAVHSDLNAIEWIWRNLKKELWNKEQFPLPMEMKRIVLEQLLTDYPQVEWQQSLKQVRSIEKEYFQHHVHYDLNVVEMLQKLRKKIITLDDESDSNEEMEITDN